MFPGGAIRKLDFEERVWKRTNLKASAREAATCLGNVLSGMTAVCKKMVCGLHCVCLAKSLHLQWKTPVNKQTPNETGNGCNN